MKTKHLAAALAALLTSLSFAAAQGTTAFTYQGRLNLNGSPANGSFDLRFELFEVAAGGSSRIDPIQVNGVPVSNGLFVAQIDFGLLLGRAYWLEIGAKLAGSANPFTVLNPRQQLTPTPYANFAARAGSYEGPIGDYQLSPNVLVAGPGGTIGPLNFVAPTRPVAFPPFTVNTSLLVSNLNADELDGFSASDFWKLGGNADTAPGAHFLGTSDNQPLELRVNNQPALRLAHATSQFFTSPNIVGGFSENRVNPGFVGGFIGGGGLPGEGGFGSNPNVVNGFFGTIGGGLGNTAGGFVSVVGGGRFNFSAGDDSFIGGGYANTNNRSAEWATIGGGHYNTVASLWGTVPGGANNTVSGRYGFAAGRRAKAVHDGAFVWADSRDADFRSTGLDQFLIRAAGGVGINTTNPGAMLQVGDANIAGSQGMIRLATRSGAGPQTRHWDIGVPRGDADVSGKFYSFVIDDPRLGTDPEVVVRWDTGNVGIGVNHPNSRLHVGAGGVRCEMGLAQKFSLGGNGSFEMDAPGIIAGRFVVTDAGDVGIGIANPLAKLHVAGDIRASGSICANNGIQCISDRNAKTGFAPVDAKGILEKVAALSITRWRYTNDTTTPHLGPVAQDFHAAFGLGGSDRTITTVDADGVALAAIQGLNQKVEVGSQRSEVRIQKLEQENLALRQRLERLEQLLSQPQSR